MQTAYRIECRPGSEICARVGFLLRKGMVFTTDRHTDFLRIKDTYKDYDTWRYIFICHKGCKRIFNTSRFDGDYVSGDYFTFINIDWNEFVRDILPTL